jgi:hypothetical protein
MDEPREGLVKRRPVFDFAVIEDLLILLEVRQRSTAKRGSVDARRANVELLRSS